MRTAYPSLTPLLRSDLQAQVLALLLLNDGREWTAAELSQATGAPASSIHRELMRGIDAGVLEREIKATPHRYSAARDSPLHDSLATLLDRTVGVEARLSDVLNSMGGVTTAFIHGSWARGRVTSSSDVDLVVVGEPESEVLRQAMREVGRKVGRRIDYTLLNPSEFERMKANEEQPLASILTGEKTWLLDGSGYVDD